MKRMMTVSVWSVLSAMMFVCGGCATPLRVTRLMGPDVPDSEAGVLHIYFPILLNKIDGKKMPFRITNSDNTNEIDRILLSPGNHTLEVVYVSGGLPLGGMRILGKWIGYMPPVSRLVITDSPKDTPLVKSFDDTRKLVAFNNQGVISIQGKPSSLSFAAKKEGHYCIAPAEVLATLEQHGLLMDGLNTEAYWMPKVVEVNSHLEVAAGADAGLPYNIPVLVYTQEAFALVKARMEKAGLKLTVSGDLIFAEPPK